MDRFEAEGMEGLFGTEKATKRSLLPAIRRFIVDGKGEHPPMSLGEMLMFAM